MGRKSDRYTPQKVAKNVLDYRQLPRFITQTADQLSFIDSYQMIKNASIRVAIKVKPTQQSKNLVSLEAEGEITLKMPGDERKTIQVDMVHDANTSKNTIYHDCHLNELMGKFIEGYNTAVLTYGQTGAGKTFAFEGDSANEGIISASISEIFSNRPANSIVKCSFLQIYNEKITDMLSPDFSNEKGLRMRWQIEKQFIIQDLSQKQCTSAEEIKREWSIGNKNRVVASNKVHDFSSRSHTIFIITMEDEDQQHNYRVRSAYFVDLAGSERVFSPVGRLSKEAIQINKSLFFLRKVILSLQQTSSTGKQQYIPYRDSKLTSILKKAFGGNCLTYLIACINPHEDYIQETISTLQYAVSARKIHNQVNINIDLKARQIRELRSDKEKLKKQLQFALMQIQNFKSIERQQELKRASNSQYANRIIQCIGTVRQLLRSNKQLRAQLQKQKSQKRVLALDLQQCEKKLKQAKKQSDLPSIKEQEENKRRTTTTFGELKLKPIISDSPNKKESGLKTEAFASPQAQMSDRPNYSHSVDLFRKKQRGKSIIHRKKYQLYDRLQGNK